LLAEFIGSDAALDGGIDGSEAGVFAIGAVDVLPVLGVGTSAGFLSQADSAAAASIAANSIGAIGWFLMKDS
jgi:hypothetical protein